MNESFPQNPPSILIESPCVGNCCLDLSDICIGCKRHVEEIKEWSLASDERKNEILALCAERTMANPSRF